MTGMEFANLICPRCGNGKYMRYLPSELQSEFDVKCINCNTYWRLSDFEKPVKRRTNYESIIQKSPEEFAEWIDNQFGSLDWCDKDRLVGGACKGIECVECIVEWLNKEEDDGE